MATKKKRKKESSDLNGGGANLTSVEEAYARNDLAGALSGALAIWDTARAAVIADAIDALSIQAARSFAPPEDLRTNVAFQAKWLALINAKDPIAVAWLADNLFVKLPGNDMDQKQEAFIARLSAVRKAPPDPRIARALMTLVEQAAPIVEWSQDHCRKTLIVIGDERTSTSLDALCAKSDEADARKWKNTRDKLPAFSSLDEAARNAWSALGPRPTRKATGDRQALFDAALAAPDDEQAREVLADCLQEQGDPRGEFISIQLAEQRGQATPEATKRADALLKQHKKAWLGALARVTYRARFRGGLIDEIELDGSWKASKKQWADLAKDPLLATATYIHGKPTPDILCQFVGSPALRALRRVDIDSDLVADAVERTTPKTLREIHATSWKRVDIAKKFPLRVIPIIEAIPSVDRVALEVGSLDVLMQSKAWKRIRSLLLPVGDQAALTIWARLPTHVESLSWGWQDTSELRRGTTGGSADLSLHLRIVNEWFGDLKSTVSRLKKTKVAEQLTRIEVEGPKKLLPKETAFNSIRRAGLVIDIHEWPHRSGLAAGIGA